MKKSFLIAAFVLMFSGLARAQEIGVRFGNVTAGSVAIDGIFGTGKFTRLHADASFGNGGLGADLLWDFIYRPLGDEAFNWYLGAGPYILIDDPFWFGAAGEIGIEYRFKDVPIALGADWRPRLAIVNTTEFQVEGFGINVRYVFGR